MFKKVLELTNIYQYFFPLTGTLLRNLVLELGVRVIYPEIVPYMKTWNLNWPVCIKRSEPQSLLVVMWPMTLPCSPWPNICLVTGFIFFLDIIIHVHNGVKILLKSHLFREHSHMTSDFQVGRQVKLNLILLNRLMQ